MITILEPFADRLNLNGDLANGLILQKRLAWAGFECRVKHLQSIQEINSATSSIAATKAPTFLLLGHGSRAAMDSIQEAKSELIDLITEVQNAGGVGLVVGSTYEWLVPHQQQPRVSQFVDLEMDLPGTQTRIPVVGYVNSAAKLDDLLWQRGILFSRLHGPLLAKSPELADYFCGVLTAGKYVSKPAKNLDGFIQEAIAVARGQRD